MKIPCRVLVYGQKTIQTALLTDLLRSKAPDCHIQFDDITEASCLSFNASKTLVLVDFSVVPEEQLVSLLDRVSERREQLFFALFNVRRDEPHRHFLDWLKMRGIFYEDTTHDQLLKGVTALLRGELWFSRDLLNRYLLNQRARKTYSEKIAYSPLTSKELQILSHVVNGHSNKEIAKRLNISDGTVKTHVYNIFKKIQVKNRVQATNWFLQYTSRTDGEIH